MAQRAIVFGSAENRNPFAISEPRPQAAHDAEGNLRVRPKRLIQRPPSDGMLL